MKEFDDEYENLYLGDVESPESLEFQYSRLIADKNRKDIAVKFVMPDKRVMSFHPDDVDYDPERMVIIVSEEVAIRRGLV